MTRQRSGLTVKARVGVWVAAGRVRRHLAWLGLCDLLPAPQHSRGKPLTEGEYSYLMLLDLAPKTKRDVREGRLSAASAMDAIRRSRKQQRKKDGKPEMGGGEWEPDWFTARHPLARKARALCDGRDHSMRRRIGKAACGECWETVIRADERTVTAALAGGGE